MASRVLASILSALGQGANQLYGHRQRQAEVGREEATAAEARAFRERAFGAENKHRAAIEALQRGQLGIQEEAQRRLREQGEAEQQAGRLDRALKRAQTLGYMPDNLAAWAAAEALGAPDIMPIEEDFQPAQTESLQGRKNVRIPGQGTIIYGPEHMSGMSTFMGNSNRESSQPIAARVNALNARLKAVEDQYKTELGKIAGTLGLEPQEAIELRRRIEEAKRTYAPGLGIGFDAQGNMYDMLDGTHAPRPATPGSGSRRRPTGSEMFGGGVPETPAGSIQFTDEELR